MRDDKDEYVGVGHGFHNVGFGQLCACARTHARANIPHCPVLACRVDI
jgi:hypothetical protein